MLAGKIHALLDGRFNVSVDDVRAVALPALRHRVIRNFEGEAEGITSDAIVRSVLDAVRCRLRSTEPRTVAMRALRARMDRRTRGTRLSTRACCRQRSIRPSSTRRSCASSSG